MKIKELQNKNESELKKTLFDLREELRVVRFNLSYGQVSNVAKIKKIKKDIARVLTVLNNSNKLSQK
ncbi:MAG: 50S ribosomal protein L29 [Parcubacteria group bacterium GW2011_GWA2_39_18]|nr:MAG: 50S ribosomal protein L29 [Parcubacteria group bacterium GW2011_GWA2_39_18]